MFAEPCGKFGMERLGMFPNRREIHPRRRRQSLRNEIRIVLVPNENGAFGFIAEHVMVICRDALVDGNISRIHAFLRECREDFFAETVFPNV